MTDENYINGILAQLRREQATIQAMHNRPWWRVSILLRRPWKAKKDELKASLWDYLTKVHDCTDPAVGCSCTGDFRFPASYSSKIT